MQLDSVDSIKVLVTGGLGAWIVPRLALTRPLASTATRRSRPVLSRHLSVVGGGRKCSIEDCAL
jgi:hypothetical protein